jgi:hypothetical protein
VAATALHSVGSSYEESVGLRAAGFCVCWGAVAFQVTHRPKLGPLRVDEGAKQRLLHQRVVDPDSAATTHDVAPRHPGRLPWRLCPALPVACLREDKSANTFSTLTRGVHMSSLSSRRHSPMAGRRPRSRRLDRFSAVIARALPGDEASTSAAVPTANAHSRNAQATCRGERGARRLFRLGSARASAWASSWAAACGSSWPLRPTPGRPCGWAACGVSGCGDIFIYVVPRGCRP